MKPEPSIFDDEDAAAEATADAEGLADIEAGRVVPHAEVEAWLETWGTGQDSPAPASYRVADNRVEIVQVEHAAQAPE